MKEILKKIISRRDLSEGEISKVIDDIFSGRSTDVKTAAFLTSLATKGETYEEVAGAARTMRRLSRRISCIQKTLVDTCGTGGDGLNTFNISTTSAFVVAGCGITVAKHGNRSVSSMCGSADLLEELGVKIDVDPEVVEEAVNQVGIGFLFAPIYHSAMKHAKSVRKELGIRTIFNMLGPLTNPAGANCQLIGVFDSHLTEMFAKTLHLLGSKRCLVVHGYDGLDEISVTSKTRISHLENGNIKTYDIDPEMIIGRVYSINDIMGGTPEENADITLSVLKGSKGAARDIVVINAAGAIIASGVANSFNVAVKIAEESIDSGKALIKLEEMKRYYNENS